jgi:hypothetical protein
MKIHGRLEVYLHAFLISTSDGYDRSASCPSRFTPSTQRRDGRVSARTGTDAEENKKELPFQKKNPVISPSPSPLPAHYVD